MKEQQPHYGPKEKIGLSLPTAIFIDGPYLSRAATMLGLRNKKMDFDFEKMMAFLLGHGRLITAGYYTGLTFSPSAQAFFNKIERFGYEVIKAVENPVTGKVAPVDHQLISDLCLTKDQWEIACVVSGDGDFSYPIERLTRDFNKRVKIVAGRHNISTHLLQLADTYPVSIQILLLDEFSDQFTMRRVFRRG